LPVKRLRIAGRVDRGAARVGSGTDRTPRQHVGGAQTVSHSRPPVLPGRGRVSSSKPAPRRVDNRLAAAMRRHAGASSVNRLSRNALELSQNRFKSFMLLLR